MRTILVIEDDRDTRLLIAHILKPTGYRIVQAENGIEGIRLFLSLHPDLVTVDVMMPRLNGFQMMTIVSQLKLMIPAIFVTVKSDIDQFTSRFPSIVDICLKADLQTDLLKKVVTALEKPGRSYTDIEYLLNEREIYGLLGKSDRKKILIVSDRLTFELVMAAFKETDIYEIYHAPNGQEAIFKAVMIRPHLILSDVDVPQIDGITLARILYILGHPFPLAFFSDKSDVGIIKKASKLEGIKGFLLKSEIRRDRSLLPSRVEQILKISAADKAKLKASYETIDLEKLENFSEDASIWASLAP
jgi:CheY-like chemotaxis protein